MERYTLEASLNTPAIQFDFKKGELTISGRSIPENSLEFYTPFFNALDEYLKKPNASTTVNVQLEYYNSSSSACLLSAFKKLEEHQLKSGKSVVINWMYEENDEDILAAGKNFEGMVKLPFSMIPLAEN